MAQSELSVDERDLLLRAKEKPELRPLLFRRIRGLKWFNELEGSGYFNPDNMPSPVPSSEEGYVRIPRWDVLEYLTNVAPELTDDTADAYASKFVEIIARATSYAKDHGFSNYQVWWQLAEVIAQIPSSHLRPDNLDVVDYWLDDKYERGLVSEVIGERWLVNLLEEEDNHSLSLCCRLMEILFEVSISEKEFLGKTKKEAFVRFTTTRTDKALDHIASLAGRRLGKRAVEIFHSNLLIILDELQNDAWSSVWQPAIEEHEQNRHHNDAENVIVQGYRESLAGYVDTSPDEATNYVSEMLESGYQTIERLAIHRISSSDLLFNRLGNTLIAGDYLTANHRHEFWQFLNQNYGDLTSDLKERVLALIQMKVRTDEVGSVLEIPTAYERSLWLAAIKDVGKVEQDLYRQAIETAGSEPDHPDFSSYMSSCWVGEESPYSVEELNSLSLNELVKTLAEYEESGTWGEPSIRGLSYAVKSLILSAPLTYYDQLTRFDQLDFAYIDAIIEAYRELWNEKSKLPWDDVWHNLLSFIKSIIGQERFWEPVDETKREGFAANRNWIVSAIGRLLEAGSKSDDHAFHEKVHNDVELILSLLLEKQGGRQFSADSDAVSIAINSPRGHCIEALINLALRACRLEDQRNQRDHTKVWAHFQRYFDAELSRVVNEEYEFATLVTNYLPNFIYMSKDWVRANLGNIFDQLVYVRWLCAMQGYSYVNQFYPEIYSYLRDHGDLWRALEDDYLQERVEERAIQHIVVAYIRGLEVLNEPDGLMSRLLRKQDYDELNHLVWFVWALREEGDNKLKEKVFAVWPRLTEIADLSSNEGKRLASNLCQWVTFLDRIDEDRKQLLMTIAPFVDVSHNAYEFVRSLARLSAAQPFDVNEIWTRMLDGSATDYPKEAIQEILSNLVAQGPDGIRAARITASKYLTRGVDRPSTWLAEIVTSNMETP